MEDLQQLLDIKAKAMINDDDLKIMWDIYNKNFEPFNGSKTCGECIREALKKLINKLT